MLDFFETAFIQAAIQDGGFGIIGAGGADVDGDTIEDLVTVSLEVTGTTSPLKYVRDWVCSFVLTNFGKK